MSGPTILVAWHDCGKAVAAMVSRPEWPEDAEYRAMFMADQAGRSISEMPARMAPHDDEWCECFSRNARNRIADRVPAEEDR